MLQKLKSNLKKLLTKIIVSEKTIKDTFLHKILGEKVFDQRLWKPTKRSVLLSVFWGTFIAFTPTIGFQMIIAGLTAYILRINIPIILLSVWISNPVTAPFIYTFEFELGKKILGMSNLPKITNIHNFFQNFYLIAKPLILGSIIVSLISAMLAYFLVLIMWKSLKKLKKYLPHVSYENNSSN